MNGEVGAPRAVGLADVQLRHCSLFLLAQTLADNHWSCASSPKLPTLVNHSSCPGRRPLEPRSNTQLATPLL